MGLPVLVFFFCAALLRKKRVGMLVPLIAAIAAVCIVLLCVWLSSGTAAPAVTTTTAPVEGRKEGSATPAPTSAPSSLALSTDAPIALPASAPALAAADIAGADPGAASRRSAHVPVGADARLSPVPVAVLLTAQPVVVPVPLAAPAPPSAQSELTIDLDPVQLAGSGIANAGSAGGAATLYGKYAEATILGKRAIHLAGAEGQRSSIVLPVADVQTISFWFFVTAADYSPTVWLMQAVSGADDSSGLLTWGFGAIWSGSCYLDGGSAKSINPNALTPFLVVSSAWHHMTLVARGVQRSSVFRLFSNANGTESMDVNVGRIRVYSRAVSEAENRASYDAGQ
jgi:hypothetical protein